MCDTGYTGDTGECERCFLEYLLPLTVSFRNLHRNRHEIIFVFIAAASITSVVMLHSLLGCLHSSHEKIRKITLCECSNNIPGNYRVCRNMNVSLAAADTLRFSR